MLPLFLYGTLRPGSWNHERWLRPHLAGPCRPARLPGHALHHVGGLPYLVAAGHGDVVVGDLADLRPEGHDDALASLDALEGTAEGHYRRVEVRTTDGEAAWAWVAGEAHAARCGGATLVASGDWLDVAVEG